MIRLLWRYHAPYYHAFLKVGPKLWRAMCRRVERSTAGGAFIDRPEPVQRCGLCDIAEVNLHKADESLPAKRAPARARH